MALLWCALAAEQHTARCELNKDMASTVGLWCVALVWSWKIEHSWCPAILLKSAHHGSVQLGLNQRQLLPPHLSGCCSQRHIRQHITDELFLQIGHGCLRCA
jgi:hypothetical protein